jgi:ankyrin repeat protein
MYKRNQIPMEEETFLTLAIKNKNCPFIKILLDYGTNIHQISRGKTPLMVAVFHQDITTIECLLKNPNIIINQQTNTGLTALIWAIFSQNKSIINLLLNAGADPEIANDKGNTPLQMAETIKKPKIIDLIQKAIDKKHKRQGK